MPKSLIAGKKFAFMELMGAPKICGPKAEFAQLRPERQCVFQPAAPHGRGRRRHRDPQRGEDHQRESFAGDGLRAHRRHGSRPSEPGRVAGYGLGSESKDLPAFVAMQSGPRGPRNATDIWGSGFLPTTYQGVPFLAGPEPIFDLKTPDGISQRHAIASDSKRCAI